MTFIGLRDYVLEDDDLAAITGSRRDDGLIRSTIEFRLQYMGFDTDDISLLIPLQAIWTAIEEIDRQLGEHYNELKGE